MSRPGASPIDNLRTLPYTRAGIQAMTGIQTRVVRTGSTPTGLTRTLLRVALIAIVALSVLLVVIAIPANLKRQSLVSLGGVEAALNSAGEVEFTKIAPGTPSARAGMLPGDILIAVDGQGLEKGPAAARTVERVKGREGTSVTLTVRTGDAAPRILDVPRSPEPGSIAERLAPLGIRIGLIVGFLLFLDIVVLLVYLAVSLVLIVRGHGTPLTSYAAIALVTFGAAATGSLQGLALEPSVWGRLAAALMPTGFAAAFTFLGFLYPSGRWVPRRSWVLAAVVAVWTVAQWFWPAARPASWGPAPALIVYLLMIVAMFASQVRRYRRIATPAERQQIKGFVLALAAVVVGYAVSQGAALALLALGQQTAGTPPGLVLVLWLISVLGYQIPYALLAVAIGRALLKHRIWDIDTTINRSLVYSALTTLLAIMSAIILPLMNRLIGKLAGKVSPLLALAFTAAFPIVAFNPLRTRIQRLVDRRMKPEDVTFDEASALLGLKVQAGLPPGDLLETLVASVAGQMDLASAAAYTPDSEGRLVLAKETPPGHGSPPGLTVDGATRDDLTHGRLVLPPEGSDFSALVPLTTGVPFADGLSGVLALGPRQNGRGYTTPLERGLRILGIEAGKAFYVARFRESNRRNLEEWLDRIERRIGSLER